MARLASRLIARFNSRVGLKVALWSMVPILGFAYTNCSRVAFDSDGVHDENIGLGTPAVSFGAITINEGAEFTNLEDVTLRLGHNSASEMYITNNMDCSAGGAWETYATSKPWKLSAKNQNVKVFAKFRDAAGAAAGTESECYSDDITHDDIAPVIAIKRAAGAYSNLANLPFEFSIVDNLSGVGVVNCVADAAWSTACQQDVKLHAMTDGPHNIKIEATDKAGNKSAPVVDSFVTDISAPTVVFNSTPAAVTNSTSGTFVFSATDALSGVAGYECRKSTVAAFAPCTSPSVGTYPLGPNTFQVRATDKAGNVSNPISYNWNIDSSVPTVQITSGPAPFTQLTTAQFTFTGDVGGTPLKVFQCRVDAGTYASCTTPFPLSGLAEGTRTFSVIGYDASNRPSAPATYTWVIDRTKPTVMITATPASRTKETNATFSFVATDGNGSGIKETQCSIDGGPYSPCTSPKPYPGLGEGPHLFSVIPIDKAELTGPAATFSWVIDLTDPIVTITSGPAAKAKTTSASLVFTAVDPNNGVIAKIECRIDAVATWEVCSSPKPYTNLAQGAHTFQVRATDAVGRVSEIKSHAWFVDTLPPSIAYTSSASGSISTTTPVQINYAITDSGVGLDVGSVRCGLNGVRAVCPAESQINYAGLAEGNYVYRIEATDLLGNSGYKDITWSVKLATIAKIQNVNVTTNDKVDVLVVIDNSISMAPKQLNMANRFHSFLDKLSGLNWQVGIVTTDLSGDADKKDGRLLEYSGMPGTYVLNSTMNYASAKSAFANTVQRPVYEGSDFEQGIAATYRTVERSTDLSIAVNQRNASLFRPGAVLSVIVVSDADETPQSGTQYRNIAANLNKDLKTMLPNKIFKFSSIIVKPGDNACLTKAGFNNEAAGFSYSAMSGLTNGIVGSVCLDDYGAQLAAIGQATSDLIKSANLDCAPIDSNGDGTGDVQIVTSTGAAAPSYTISGLTISFAVGLPAGVNQLKYNCTAN